MAAQTIIDKLKILANAAKYDASCASSGSAKRNSLQSGGIGSTEGMGICHAYAPDGRCISLLKILMTNFCIYDCSYCINRVSSNVERARFTPQEIVRLTLDFYKRNYIEGLFLSSGVIRNADYTMEQMIEVVRTLREEHLFQGYIHLKTIPNADPILRLEAAKFADRVSINIELPKDQSIDRFAPEKSGTEIRSAMAHMRTHLDDEADKAKTARRRKEKAASPAGQSTQMIVGADAASDGDILKTSSSLYAGYGLRRVYYSAYSPIPDTSSHLPPLKTPLIREHRLYQADWLMRFYGFEIDEIAGPDRPMLDLDIDPKLAWALAARDRFPVDINRADREALLRVPGLGVKAVNRIIAARRHGRLRYADLSRLVQSVRKIAPFIVTGDWTPGGMLDAVDLRQRLAPAPEQLSLI